MLELLFSIYLTNTEIQENSSPEFFLKQSHTIEVSSIPKVISSIDAILSAESYLAVDTESNVKIFGKNSEKQLPIASLTKLMTALIILENHDLDEIVIVPKNALEVEGKKLWLLANERITVENLLKGLLVTSGNDSAIALAQHHSKSVENFLNDMNLRAYELQMKNSYFKNPHGLDMNGHYSSSEDLIILIQSLWKFKNFREIVSMKTAKVYSLSQPTRVIDNTNKLLSNEVKGIKTGTTDAAGQCLALYVEKDGHKIFTVVLGSKKRFDDSSKLLDEIWNNIDW